MVLSVRNNEMDEAMPQTVPSAGFTPPCDYSAFVCDFDVSLLTGEESLSPSATFYAHSPPPEDKIKIYTSFYPTNPTPPQTLEEDLGPDFQKLLVPDSIDTKYPPSVTCGIYLDVPKANSPGNYHANSPIGAVSPYSQGLLSPNEQFSNFSSPEPQTFYPNSPDNSYTTIPSPFYSRSPREDSQPFIKQETPYPSSPNNFFGNVSDIDSADVFKILASTTLEKQIKQESTVDFRGLLTYQETSLRQLLESPVKKTEVKSEDHHLLRECLRDTSYQKKYNIKPIEFNILDATSIKMEEPDDNVLGQELAAPVLKIYMEQMKKDISATCEKLNISPDPSRWTSKDVLSWLESTSKDFGFPAPAPEQWDMDGSNLVILTEEDFTSRSPQGGVKLYAQLELWKAAYLENELNMQWLPEPTSSNASNGDVSDADDDDETSTQSDTTKPTTSRTGGSNIHLWQFLKELLSSPQVHGSCIRWLDRSKGVFKIEDSVKVARLWGKRKNRPAMNYDKLSRSIRQYYKKGIMKKTERSQRLVYQFCHPYSL